MKGIMIKEELFKVVIEGRKTQTRRLVPPIKYFGEKLDVNNGVLVGHAGYRSLRCAIIDLGTWGVFDCRPRYKEGEIVYLKEPYMADEDTQVVAYKYWPQQVRTPNEGLSSFTYYKSPETCKWENKMFMPEKYARYFIKITKVRLERVTNISRFDAIAEGVKQAEFKGFYVDYLNPNRSFLDPVRSFHSLWDNINVRWNRAKDDYRGYMFKDSPYVWVYEFELTTPINYGI